MKAKSGNEAGFSLVELMVAVLITLIITGAVYGLLAGGQTAFRREPERTELQQNLRTAMAFVMRDIANAGSGPGCDSGGQMCDGLTAGAQVFTAGLDGSGPAVPGGGNSDILEVLYADPNCQPMPVNHSLTLSGGMTLGPCFAANPTAIVIVNSPDATGQTYWGLARGLTSATTTVAFAPTQPAGANPTGNLANATSLSVGKLVRYQVCTLAGDPLPSLCRSDTGGYDNSGAATVAPDPTGSWQVIARGIENMQVEYHDGAAAIGAAWAPTADVVDRTTWQTTTNTITREVRVTLSGRGSLTNIQGQSGPAGVVQTLRAQMISSGSPRAALFWLQTTPPAGNALWSAWLQASGARS